MYELDTAQSQLFSPFLSGYENFQIIFGVFSIVIISNTIWYTVCTYVLFGSNFRTEIAKCAFRTQVSSAPCPACPVLLSTHSLPHNPDCQLGDSLVRVPGFNRRCSFSRKDAQNWDQDTETSRDVLTWKIENKHLPTSLVEQIILFQNNFQLATLPL